MEHSNSRKFTVQRTPLIKYQNKQYAFDNPQIKKAKQVVKKEKENRCHTSLDQLRNNLSEKSKTLLEISIEKNVSNNMPLRFSIQYCMRCKT